MKMNAKKLIAAVAVLAAAGTVLADNSLPYIDYGKLDSALSRAEAVAGIDPGVAGHSTANNDVITFSTVGSALTRADVRAEIEKDFAEGLGRTAGAPEFIESTQIASTEGRDRAHDEAVRSAMGKALQNTANDS